MFFKSIRWESKRQIFNNKVKKYETEPDVILLNELGSKHLGLITPICWKAKQIKLSKEYLRKNTISSKLAVIIKRDATVLNIGANYGIVRLQ